MARKLTRAGEVIAWLFELAEPWQIREVAQAKTEEALRLTCLGFEWPPALCDATASLWRAHREGFCRVLITCLEPLDT